MGYIQSKGKTDSSLDSDNPEWARLRWGYPEGCLSKGQGASWKRRLRCALEVKRGSDWLEVV